MDRAADMLRTLKRVRSTRDFTDRPVDDALVTEILDVARWTGSGMNRQPWQFLVVRDRAALAAIAEAAPNARHIGTAAVAIVVVMPAEGGAIATFDEARAAERMLVAATALGLGSAVGWINANARARVAELFGLPVDRTVRTLVSLGYPSARGSRPKSAPGEARRPLESFVHRDRWE